MKKLLVVLVVLIFLATGLIFAKDFIAKAVLVNGIRALTGLEISVGEFGVGFLKSLLSLGELKIYNPRGFPDPIMAEAPQLYVDYDPAAFFSGVIHFEEVRINLHRFFVVRNRDGKLNLSALKPVAAVKRAEPKAEGKKAKPKEFVIDRLYLKVGTVIYKDYTKGTPPQVTEFPLNLNERYENVTDPEKLVNLIVVRATINTAIAKLANFDLSILKGSVADVLDKGVVVLKDATKKLEETLSELGQMTGKIEGLEKPVETGKKLLKSILNQAQDLIKEKESK